MRFCRTSCAIVVLAAVAGCSRQQTASSCQPDERYAGARSALPVQIPDDLSPPNESDAIRLPPDLGGSSAVTAGECLEAPPPFFGDSRPFLNGADSEEQSRQSRREARRAARNEAPAEAQPGAAQPPPSAPPPANDDRVIDN
jgi:uncharacterized lipoprotein